MQEMEFISGPWASDSACDSFSFAFLSAKAVSLGRGSFGQLHPFCPGRYLKSVWSNTDLDVLSPGLDRVWTSGAGARVARLCASSLPLVPFVKLAVGRGPTQSWVYEVCCATPLSGHIAFFS